MKGQIIRIISNLYTVKTPDGLHECRARGRFRNDGMTPLVGDEVLIDEKNDYIMELLPRKNALSRPMIANVDAALIVTSIKKPDLSLSLLDKQITIITLKNIEPIICFTKSDLLSKSEKKKIKQLANYYKKIGFKVFYNTEIRKIKKALKNQIVVLTGQTGAGKSSLLNVIAPSLALKTAPISESLGRGVHTTRHVELFKIEDLYLADTPGFSALDFEGMTKESLRDSFPECSKNFCQFQDCFHQKEENCWVKSELEKGKILASRYENYLRFLKEVEQNESKRIFSKKERRPSKNIKED